MAKKILCLYFIKKSTKQLAKSNKVVTRDFVCVYRDKLVPQENSCYFKRTRLWASSGQIRTATKLLDEPETHELIDRILTNIQKNFHDADALRSKYGLEKASDKQPISATTIGWKCNLPFFVRKLSVRPVSEAGFRLSRESRSDYQDSMGHSRFATTASSSN